jgi:hypothetical protein
MLSSYVVIADRGSALGSGGGGASGSSLFLLPSSLLSFWREVATTRVVAR